ncbi:hypothetical protein HGRIS_004801 [Hohenbuehelia grisea]|uniref:SCA7 domain-containing protein n=1 Tax=Hohenbuehelia grisea TaxID=104357 RepID=A0ABR3JDV7_9AGAR
MALKLKRASPSPPPFSWDRLPSTPSPPPNAASIPSPPAIWLSARDMKVYGARPMTSSTEIGLVKCKECDKPLLRSSMAEHSENCEKIRSGGKKGVKGKAGSDAPGSKKRKASPELPEASAPAKKKAKPAPKVTKGRVKGPVDLDRHCGVINDKNLPCSRALTCKSHSMGAKRAVQGRSRDYDELLLDWQRANNPNFVEPVKRETKAEKKEKKEREKQEKKRLAMEAAAAAGLDPSTVGKKVAAAGAATKKTNKKAAAAAAVRTVDGQPGDDGPENLDDVDSEVEADELIKSFRIAREKGVVGVPLALPCDAGSWFVQRREKARCCHDLLLSALGHGGGTAGPGGGLGLGMGAPTLAMPRAGSLGLSAGRV